MVRLCGGEGNGGGWRRPGRWKVLGREGRVPGRVLESLICVLDNKGTEVGQRPVLNPAVILVVLLPAELQPYAGDPAATCAMYILINYYRYEFC